MNRAYKTTFALAIFGANFAFDSLAIAQEANCSSTVPGQVLCDDFSDGNSQDGTLENWIPSSWSSDASISADAGGIRLSGIVIAEDFPIMGNTSIRARIKIPEDVGDDNVFIGVQTRRDDATNDGYSAALRPIQGSALVVRETDSTVLGSQPVNIDVRHEDVMLQFDAIEDTLKLWVWRPGENVPLDPIVTVNDSTHSAGVVSLFVSNFDGPNPEGVFRFVQVADTHIPIPEPSTTVLTGFGLTSLLILRRRAPRSDRRAESCRDMPSRLGLASQTSSTTFTAISRV